MADRLRVACLSLEPWDAVWRRNQHLASRLQPYADVLFVTPPRGGFRLRATVSQPAPAVEVVEPPLVVPRRAGGHAVLGRWLRRRVRTADVLWINDPVAGAAALRPGRAAVYDVTDDWRSMPQPAAERRRIVAAEDALAGRATTVVCSAELARRWHARYGVDATLVPNGVDVAAIRAAVPVTLDGPGPHVLYAGTLHANRFDVDLALSLAGAGTLHLVGPDHLEPADRARLAAAGVLRHGAVPHEDVPRWLAAADVLVCPHRVDDFTRSLDAIKAHEYLATDRPVVATPSSGFQDVAADGLRVVDRDGFVAAVRELARSGPWTRPAPGSWDDRAAAFAAALQAARGG